MNKATEIIKKILEVVIENNSEYEIDHFKCDEKVNKTNTKEIISINLSFVLINKNVEK